MSSIEKYTSRALAPNTLRTYQFCLKRLQNWLHQSNLELSDRLLAEYLIASYESGLSQSFCSLTVAAVRWHSSTTGQAVLLEPITPTVLKAIRRSSEHGVGQVKGLTWKEADQVIYSQRQKNTPAGWRNAALIAIASDALLRVSEIQALEVQNLELNVVQDGFSVLEISRSKTDQMGKGAKMRLGPPTTDVIERWLDVSRISIGKVFRRLSPKGRVMGNGLSVDAIRTIIKASISEAGFEGRYSGHSLRVGSAKSLAERGASLVGMMQDGRWNSPKMLVHYASGELSSRSETSRLRYRQLRDHNSQYQRNEYELIL